MQEDEKEKDKEFALKIHNCLNDIVEDAKKTTDKV